MLRRAFGGVDGFAESVGVQAVFAVPANMLAGNEHYGVFSAKLYRFSICTRNIRVVFAFAGGLACFLERVRL